MERNCNTRRNETLPQDAASPLFSSALSEDMIPFRLGRQIRANGHGCSIRNEIGKSKHEQHLRRQVGTGSRCNKGK